MSREPTGRSLDHATHTTPSPTYPSGPPNEVPHIGYYGPRSIAPTLARTRDIGGNGIPMANRYAGTYCTDPLNIVCDI